MASAAERIVRLRPSSQVEFEVGISDGAVAHVCEEVETAVAVVGEEGYPVDVGVEVADELYVFVDVVLEEATADDVVERVDVNYVMAIEYPMVVEVSGLGISM